MTIRTRFAPSPTGHVHIGNIRAAIYNWLFARHEGGKFLLRVEDTDRERSTDEAIHTLLEAMEWLGLSHDEEPLYQSTRQAAHLAVAEELLSKGFAYKEDKGGTGRGDAVVFNMPGKDMSFHDEIKGDLSKASADMKDFVIVRSNGTPVFHLANVVDDVHMGITHVIRGDDHVENTYRHLALYQAIGAETPKFAHLPMITNAQGKPYSKRDGDAYVGEFREAGFLPDALFNYLALLGWSPGDDREVLSRNEMVELFTLDRVQSSAAQMDRAKLEWMNGQHMALLPLEERAIRCREVMEKRGLWRDDISEEYFLKVIELLGDRIKFFSDIADESAFFFTEDYEYEEKAARKRLRKEGALEGMRLLRDRFAELEEFTASGLEEVLRGLAEENEWNPGVLIHPVRVAVSGKAGGPGLFEMLQVIGKERVLSRMDKAVVRFSE
ncbi:MAG: glutamate--tRNA ligase [Verrucomicrobia bacterium]|nr:glutamate--tRNA ligase [Verrucomicrobiota bacterium]